MEFKVVERVCRRVQRLGKRRLGRGGGAAATIFFLMSGAIILFSCSESAEHSAEPNAPTYAGAYPLVLRNRHSAPPEIFRASVRAFPAAGLSPEVKMRSPGLTLSVCAVLFSPSVGFFPGGSAFTR